MICPVCGNEYSGRPYKLTCSTDCKKAAKRAYDRARYEANRVETIQRSKEWFERNKARKQSYDQSYRAQPENADRIRERVTRWKSEHRDVTREQAKLYTAKRRALSAGEFSVTRRDIERLLTRFGGRCAYCRSAVSRRTMHLDHVVPIVRGGRHSIGNLVPACPTCNHSKSVRFVAEWRAEKVVPNRFMIL